MTNDISQLTNGKFSSFLISRFTDSTRIVSDLSLGQNPLDRGSGRLRSRHAPQFVIAARSLLDDHIWPQSYVREAVVIRKLKSGKYRLYSLKKDPKTGKRRNLGTFNTREEAEKHERAVQFFKRRG